MFGDRSGNAHAIDKKCRRSAHAGFETGLVVRIDRIRMQLIVQTRLKCIRVNIELAGIINEINALQAILI